MIKNTKSRDSLTRSRPIVFQTLPSGSNWQCAVSPHVKFPLKSNVYAACDAFRVQIKCAAIFSPKNVATLSATRSSNSCDSFFKFTVIDSPDSALHFWYWHQVHRMKRSAVKSLFIAMQRHLLSKVSLKLISSRTLAPIDLS